MASRETCHKCGSEWDYLPGDLYCPMCGAKIPFLHIELPHCPNIFADRPNSVRLAARIKNVSGSKLTIQGVKSDPPCFSAAQAQGISLQAGAESEIELEYSRSSLDKGAQYPLTCTITFVSTSGDRDHEDDCTITIHPQPTAKIDPEPIIVSESGINPITKTLTVKLNETAQHFMESYHQTNGHTWFTIKSLEKKTGTLVIDIQPERIDPGAMATGVIKIGVAGYGPIHTEFTVIRSPLEFQDKSGWKVFVGQHLWFGLAFTNRMSSEFCIEEASVVRIERDGTKYSDSKDAVRLNCRHLPLKLGGSAKRRGYDFRLGINAQGLPPGGYAVTVEFVLKDGVNGSFTETFDVEVSEPGDYLPFVALDFGTCNSCTAAEDSTLLVDQSKLAYSNDEFFIGIDAGSFSQAWVSSVKLLLGKDDPLLNGKPARDLAYEYLLQLLWRTELKLTKRVRRVVFTHPSRFTNRQLNDLRYCVQKLKLEGYIDSCYLIDEASAAAVRVVASMVNLMQDDVSAGGDVDTHFVADREEIDRIKEMARNESFTLFVFDFGGGTIDMTFSEVSFPEQGTKTVRLLNVGGMRQFGGEHVNEMILEIIADRFREQLVKEKGWPRNTPWIPVRRSALSQNPLGFDEHTLNTIAQYISSWMEDVEETKRELFRQTHDQPRKIELRAYWGPGPKQTAELDSETRISYSEFETKVRTNLGTAVETMKRLIQEAPTGDERVADPTLVVLAGGSSKIPFVKEMICEAFPESNVVFANPLKDCVARGAAFYGNQKSHPGQSVVEVEGMGGKTRSGFGYAAYDGSHKVFKPFVKKGTDLPVVEKRIPELKGVVRVGVHFELLENFGFGTKLAAIQHDIEKIDEFLVRKEDVAHFNAGDLVESEVSITLNEDESIILKLHANGKEAEFKFKDTQTYRVACND